MTRVRVLIADDDAILRATLCELVQDDPTLELAGAAKDADEAINLARQHQPDVAIVDVKMPRGGGPKAAREIRSVSPKTRSVALSAYGDRTAVIEMLKAGAVGYLLKGASTDDIHQAIHRSLKGHAAVDAEVAGELIQELSEQLRREASEGEERKRRIRRIRAVLGGTGLSMTFQPIFDLTDGDIVGFEALALFEIEPRRSPDQWFAEAQGVGLGVELEMAAASAALEQLGEVPADTFLSLNLSPDVPAAQAFAHSFPDVPGDRVVVEVTEHTAVDDYPALLGALEGLRSRGVRLAIDDAGAGYASLRHILRLSPDFIKLDVDLTRGIDTDRKRRALAKALIAFASETGSVMVAEGIETEEELKALRHLGVTLGQGYHLARPGPLPASSPVIGSPMTRGTR